MSHIQQCRQKFRLHSDAARRMADHYNLHRAAMPHDSVGKWVAIALADGDSDGAMYDSKLDCIRHQHHNERYYAFVCIVPSTMSPCEAEIFLRTNRRLYDAGMRMTD